MTTQSLLNVLLVLHITGFTMMAGAFIANFSIHRRLNKYLNGDKQKAVSMIESAEGFPRLIGIGALLLVSSGIGMVLIYHGLFARMLWFRIKMILVVVAFVNGSLVPRRNAAKLKTLLLAGTGGNNEQIISIRNRMNLFHVVQLFLFLIIFILSVFRF